MKTIGTKKVKLGEARNRREELQEKWSEGHCIFKMTGITIQHTVALV